MAVDLRLVVIRNAIFSLLAAMRAAMKAATPVVLGSVTPVAIMVGQTMDATWTGILTVFLADLVSTTHFPSRLDLILAQNLAACA